jgi:hypothetical protein
VTDGPALARITQVGEALGDEPANADLARGGEQRGRSARGSSASRRTGSAPSARSRSALWGERVVPITSLPSIDQ